MFWFRKNNNAQPQGLAVIMFILLGLCFLVFVGIVKIYGLRVASVWTKADLAEKVAWGVNKDAADLIRAGSILYQTIASGWSLLDHEAQIHTISTIIKSKSNLEKYIPEKYQSLYELWKQLIAHEDQVMSLLWEDRTKTYLIALMNTAESRPNGGFFGSYAIIQLYRGKLITYKVFDSYYAYHQNSGVNVILDPNYQTVLGQQSINFISPNVYGFTDIDAGNIKLLYEKLFLGQNLDGIIMVKSELFEQLIPELKQKLIEWQFVNASIDIIRWQSLPNKKEQYLTDIGSYIESNKSQLIEQIVKNLPYILRGWYIQVYLPNANEEFKQFLADKGLRTIQDPDTLYAWQINKSFNKIDKFVTKKITLQSNNGQIIEESTNGVMSLNEKSIPAGDYELYFFYTLSVPQSYIDQVYGLTKEYDIELTQRETHILWLSYNRHNQLIIRLPERLQFTSIDGDYFKDYKLVNMKHRQIVSFELLSFGNDVLKVVRMKVKKL